MYKNLVTTYVYWFQARGESFRSARVAVTCALTAAAIGNVTVILVLLQKFFGVAIADALIGNAMIYVFLFLGLLIVNWLWTGTVAPATSRELVPRRFPWIVYMIASMAFWFIGCVILL